MRRGRHLLRLDGEDHHRRAVDRASFDLGRDFDPGEQRRQPLPLRVGGIDDGGAPGRFAGGIGLTGVQNGARALATCAGEE